MKVGNIEVYGVIYKIRNKVNNKVYIGQTINGFDKRYPYSGEGIEKVYNTCLKNNESGLWYNRHLFSSIKKYGFSSFEVFPILDVAFSKEELDIKEDIYIKLNNSIKKGYNNKTGGGNGIPSEETIGKMKDIISKRVGINNIVEVHSGINFNNYLDANRIFNIYHSIKILNCSNKKQRFVRDDKTGTIYKFMFLWEYISHKYLNNAKNPIIHLNTMTIYDCKKSILKKVNCTKNRIECCVQGKVKVNKDKDNFIYLKDYIQQLKVGNNISVEKILEKENIKIIRGE